MAVCDKTFHLLQSEPYAGMFVGLEPRVEIPLDQAQVFDGARSVVRSPRETKGLGYRETSESIGPCCGSDEPCC
jgi:hypothetical protein